MPKRRLDTLLAERGLFETRTRAAAAVMAGDVRVGDRPGPQAGRAGGARRRPGGRRAPGVRVARRASKLANALDALGIDPAGRRALDVGASTGGFTDCLLQRGAEAVIALDVAYGELHWTLRNDPRVTVIERRNARVARAGRAALGARPDRRRRVVHLAHQGAAGGARVRRAALRLPRARQAAVRGRARAGGEGRRRARCRRPARRRSWRSAAQARDELGAAVLGFASSGPARAGRQPRELRLAGGGGPAGRGRGPRRGGEKSGAVTTAGARRARSRSSPHTRPADTGGALRRIVELAGEAGVEVRLPPAEVGEVRRGPRVSTRSPDPTPTPTSPSCSAATARSSPRCGVRGHRRAGVRDQLRGDRLPRARSSRGSSRTGVRRALRGEFDVMELPGAARAHRGRRAARDQRRLASPPPERPRGGARLLGRGRAARRGALRRAGGRPPPPARRATTSPTAGRCWPGAWRASWCPSSRRTRSRRERWWWRRATRSR